MTEDFTLVNCQIISIFIFVFWNRLFSVIILRLEQIPGDIKACKSPNVFQALRQTLLELFLLILFWALKRALGLCQILAQEVPSYGEPLLVLALIKSLLKC